MSTQLAERIVYVPELYEAGDKSTAALLQDAGFPEREPELSVADVEAALKRDPALADRWLARGGDQRFAGGWGIECDGPVYRLQHFGTARHLCEADRLHACAEFIVRYVGVIGAALRRWR